jgi:predicted nucleotidyltransferase
MNIPNEIQDLCQVFLRGLNMALGDKLVGVYLYGALAFPEGGPTGDIDFHVILSETLNDREKSDLNDLHATLARDFPPLGVDMDGYYILLEEARQTSPPRHQLLADVVDKSWALHREHIRAGRCIVLQGPDPRQVYPAASWPELESALQGELDYVANHLTEYPDYCVLNLCRLIYSFDTGDVVVSKRASARWAHDAYPEWRPHIEAAIKSYDRRATAEDREILASEVTSFFDFACERIRESSGKSAMAARAHLSEGRS